MTDFLQFIDDKVDKESFEFAIKVVELINKTELSRSQKLVGIEVARNLLMKTVHSLVGFESRLSIEPNKGAKE